MSTGRESSSDAHDASRFAPKWARDPEQNGPARRPTRAHGDIWLGDAEEAARDDFRCQEGGGKLGLFRPPLEPTVIPDVWSASLRRSNTRRFMGLVAAVLAVAGVAFEVIARVSGAVSDQSRLALRRRGPHLKHQSMTIGP